MSLVRLIRRLFGDFPRKRQHSTCFSSDEASEMLRTLIRYGYAESDVTVDSGHVWVNVVELRSSTRHQGHPTGSSLEITKDAIHIHGEKNDLAIAAALQIIKEQGSEFKIELHVDRISFWQLETRPAPRRPSVRS